MACTAYIAASEDPSRGNGKKKEVFIGQILDTFTKFCEEKIKNNPGLSFHQRTGEAILQRYKKARTECLKFEGIVYAIKQKKPTGSPSENDIERAALAVYNGDANISDMYTYFTDSTLDPGPGFPFQQTLYYLRKTNTWTLLLMSREAKQSAARSSFDGEIDASSGSLAENGGSAASQGAGSSNIPIPTSAGKVKDDLERPVGSKRAADLAKKFNALNRGADGISKLSEASAARNRLSQELLEVEKQRALLEKKKYCMALFAVEGTDAQKRKKFIEMLQDEVLEEMEREKKKMRTRDSEREVNASQQPHELGQDENCNRSGGEECLDLVEPS